MEQPRHPSEAGQAVEQIRDVLLEIRDELRLTRQGAESTRALYARTLATHRATRWLAVVLVLVLVVLFLGMQHWAA